MRYGKTLVSISCSILVSLSTITIAQSQDNKIVEIVGYTHGACIVGGEELRPMWADDGHISRHRVPKSGYWDCEDTINTGIIGCERAVTHVYSFHNEKYPECLKLFESWVSECKEHYERQRHKCDLGDQSAADDGNRKGEVSHWIEEGLQSNLKEVLERAEQGVQGVSRDKPGGYESPPPEVSRQQQIQEREERSRKQRASSGDQTTRSSGSGGERSKCRDVRRRVNSELERGIEELLSEASRMMESPEDNGACKIANMNLRIYENAKGGLARHGCYDGGLDRPIAEFNAAVRSTCN